MRVLIVDNYLDPAGGTHNFARYLGDTPWTSTRPTREPLPEHREFDAVILTGSGANMPDGYGGEGTRDGWMDELVAWTRQVVLEGVPTLGVCFGHQVLGAAFGDGVGKAVPPEAGFLPITQTVADPLLDRLPERFVCFLSHEDQVDGPGEHLDVLATSALCETQAVRVRGHRAWGIQFHAEMSVEEARTILQFRAGKHPELGLDVEAELARSAQMAGVGEAVFGRFLELAR